INPFDACDGSARDLAMKCTPYLFGGPCQIFIERFIVRAGFDFSPYVASGIFDFIFLILLQRILVRSFFRESISKIAPTIANAADTNNSRAIFSKKGVTAKPPLQGPMQIDGAAGPTKKSNAAMTIRTTPISFRVSFIKEMVSHLLLVLNQVPWLFRQVSVK
ncbi:MAG: hypothetical protein ACREBQ_08795, partial [Nitrososphaerales archaeon]